MDAARRDRRLEALTRLGTGEETLNFDEHHELMHPDFADYRLGARVPVIGVDAYVDALRAFRLAIADFAVEIPIPWILDGSQAVTAWVYRGRVVQPIWGLTPNGAAFEWRGCSVWTFDDDDRVTELRTFADVGQLLAQIAGDPNAV